MAEVCLVPVSAFSQALPYSPSEILKKCAVWSYTRAVSANYIWQRRIKAAQTELLINRALRYWKKLKYFKKIVPDVELRSYKVQARAEDKIDIATSSFTFSSVFLLGI